MNRFVLLAILSVLADIPFLQRAMAETWPDQPIHIVVPFTPGSATDVVARIVAAEMSRNLGQPIIIDNRPGAGGTIGAGQVARAEPSGYTLLVNSSAHTVNPAIYPDLTFDTRVDLRAITMLAQQPNILVAAPSKGWKTAADYAQAAAAEPGKLTYATAGTGSGTHMNAEKFRLSAQIGVVHVPYRGTPEALRDTMNGETDLCFCPIVAALPMIKQGRIVALANGSPRRSPALPDLATTEEQGFPDSGYTFWIGLFAPASTPRTVIDRLNAEAKRALESPEVRERLLELGTDPSPTTSQEFERIIKWEIRDNIDLAKKAAIRMQ
ncbi:tripartite tricarboxylate transporter substrate binding protein [Reyranella soli]|uniref:MFS transporter n=1 Tax=Reyranella soli TaxID=1230389 RepID=A0A512N668_9HYPH|nr:tripartite tricarboxylate transporter substrate binding protein [Reyranella soli]GEP54423.1 MFS transporter [Reyranella soli]